MGLKAAIQALQKAEKLKEKVQRCGNLLEDNEAWICQQQLRRIYRQVLLLDLEYALDRKVEQDLWSHGFKNYIGTLQALAKDKKNLKRSESQAMLSWCLEAASGFYLTLLQDICTAFDLDLPFRRKGSVYGSGKQWKAIEELNPPHHSSCNYICQHCLVHLGDIARYRSQNRQAEAFYRHAVLPAPSNGHPYNQLALLEASRGDRLATVFHYVRSIAVRHPFQAAATNLERTFSKSVEEKLNVEGRAKLSVSEYVSVFLKLHGLLHGNIELQQAETLSRLLNTTLTAHVATEGLNSWRLVQMLVINLFALHHAGSCMDANTITTFSDEQLSGDERRIKRLVTDLLAGSLSAFLLPVYTLKDHGETLLEYFALPAIKLMLDWIRLEPSVLSDSAFTSRLQIWPSLCKLLNGLRTVLGDLDSKKYSYVPLPEDRDLQCFLPLEKAFSGLRFSSSDWSGDQPSASKLRAARLVAFGDWLAEQTDCRLVVKKALVEGEETGQVFEAVGGQQVPPSDLIRELEELSLTKLSSPAPSEGSSWGSSATGSSTPDNLLVVPVGPPSPPEHATPQPVETERRAGILKPQGSLEKSREKEPPPPESSVWASNSTGHMSMTPPRRGRQNVAMSAILRKAGAGGGGGMDHDMRSTEAKQVTFKSPSPTAPHESTGASHESMGLDGEPRQSKTVNWQHQQHHQKLQVQFKQQQAQQQQIQQLKQQQQLQQQQQQQSSSHPASVHYPFQTPPPPIHHPSQSQRMNVFTESNHAQHQNAAAPFNAPFLNQIPFHQPPPSSKPGPVQDQLHYPQSQPYSGGSPLPTPAQYSPWQSNEALPMPPTSWCSADGRRLSRPPGMIDHSVPVPVPSPASNVMFPRAANSLHQNHHDDPAYPGGWGSNVRQPMGSYGGAVQRPSGGDQLSVFGPRLRDDSTPTTDSSTLPLSSMGAGNTYSLFSSPSWAGSQAPSCGNVHMQAGLAAGGGVAGGQAAMGQQSLWSGPGPSPLERLLEQQKQLREGPAPMGGT